MRTFQIFTCLSSNKICLKSHQLVPYHSPLRFEIQINTRHGLVGGDGMVEEYQHQPASWSLIPANRMILLLGRISYCYDAADAWLANRHRTLAPGVTISYDGNAFGGLSKSQLSAVYLYLRFCRLMNDTNFVIVSALFNQNII